MSVSADPRSARLSAIPLTAMPHLQSARACRASGRGVFVVEQRWWRAVVRRVSMLAVLTASIGLSGVAVASSRKPPKYDHVVVVVMENHTFEQISLAGRAAPYLNKLAKGGALFDRSYGVAHPSQPNYFALFSGLTQDVHDDG